MAEFELPYAKQLNRGVRKELGYVIGHQGDNPVVRLLPSGTRLVVRSGHLNTVAKSEGIISLIEQGIQGAKRQRFDDLISEIQDFYSDRAPIRDTPVDIPVPAMLEPAPAPEHTLDQDTISFGSLPITRQQQDAPVVNSPDPTRTDTTEGIPVSEEPNSEPMSGITRQPDMPPQTSALRRSSRSGAHKPPGFYSKLASGDSVADYTACHMRVDECSRLHGPDVTRVAGIKEVLNMIKERRAAAPQDFRKLSPRVIREAVSSFMFFKAKDLLPDETNTASSTKPTLHVKDESSASGWREVKSKRARKIEKMVKVRGRWVGGGHQQQRGEVLVAERLAPTTRGTTHSILMAIAAFEGRKILVGDIPSAYLQAEHIPANGKAVHIIADRYTTKLIVEAMPEYQDYVRPNGTMILKVMKAMYGLVESAWLWYKELERHLVSIGHSVSSNDRGLFYKKVFKNGKCVASNIASVHVDDTISAASNNPDGKKLEAEFWNSMEQKWPGIRMQRGPQYKHLSWNIEQDHKSGAIRKSQKDYLNELVKEVGVEREHKLPCRSDLLNPDVNSPKLGDKEISRFRSILQKVAYAREGRPDFDFVVCYLQSKQSSPTEQDWGDLLRLLGYIKRFPEKVVTFAPSDLQLRGYTDASFNITVDARSYFGYIITLGGLSSLPREDASRR